jgi:hypothetical protein
LREKEVEVKKQTVLTAALISLALGAAALTSARPAQAQSNPVALGEALKHLEKTLTRHGSIVIGGILRRLEARDFRGCKITYEVTPQVAPGHMGYVPHIERFTVDLSALDPARVEARGGHRGAVVIFITRGGRRAAIETRVADEPHAFGGAKHFRANHFPMVNRAGAEEVRAALVRAVELCAR